MSILYSELLASKKREEHLKAMVDVLSAKIAELKQQLQQPIIVEWQYPHWNDDEWSTASGELKYMKDDFCLVEINGQPTVIKGAKFRPKVEETNG